MPRSLNLQTPKQRSGLRNLQLHSIFNTIQGEGPNAGRPATFIRLGGCNLQCIHCDTEYTFGVTERTPLQVFNRALELLQPLVVITGGEPFRQETALIHLLGMLSKQPNLKIDIETNGTFPLAEDTQRFLCTYDHKIKVICSPKTGACHKSYIGLVAAWKIVVGGPLQPDGWPQRVLGGQAAAINSGKVVVGYSEKLKDHLIRISPYVPVYVQPEDYDGINGETSKKNQAAAIDLVMRHPEFTLGSQLHKMHNLP